MDAIGECHQAIHGGHPRVMTIIISIDDDATRTQTMAEVTAKVDARRQQDPEGAKHAHT